MYTTFCSIREFSSYVTSVVVFSYDMPKRIVLRIIAVNT